LSRAVGLRPGLTHSASALQELLGKTQILASLQVQSTKRDPVGVFIRIHSAIVLAASTDWNEANVQTALADFVRTSLTASQLGLAWQQKSGHQELDGLWPLAVSVRGKYLLVADDPALVEKMLLNFSRQTDMKPALVVAGFSHEHERANIARFSEVVDRNNAAQQNFPGVQRQPQFFSENMVSLSATLGKVSSEKIVVRLDGSKVLQTVTYQWSE